MPRGFSKFAAAGVDLCLALLCLTFGLSLLPLSPPAPLGADAPADAFSATRARGELSNVLGADESPHPIGSDANNRVEARLVARLTALGYTPEIQDTIGCSASWPTCGRVKNVLARLEGERAASILLMAHYDSVAFAPGAGDDGAGVATLLEVARALRASATPKNSIVFAFTDGEEPGLLGAEAFFGQHAWARDVGTVINLEGSGSSGPVILLRSGPRSGRVLDTFRAVARHAVASSFAEEVFKHLPNNTDFAIAARADKPGADFAFAGERNHYHTRLDTLENLSSATLQHHGDNVLPLVRALADQDLSVRTPTYVYSTLTQTIWVAYRQNTGLFLSIAIVVVLGFVTWRRWQGLGRFAGACGIVALTLVTIVAFEIGALALVDALAGTRVAWPADPWPWRLVIYSVPIVATLLQRPLVRRVGFWNSLLATWWLWALANLAIARFMPLGSHLLLPATLVATLALCVLAFARALDRPAIRCSVAVAISVVAGFFMLSTAYMGEVTMGLLAAPIIYVPLAMLAITLLPLLDRGRVKWVRGGAFAVTLVGIAWAHWTTLYSDQRPQHLNFTYAFDADANRAFYLPWSPNPLPPAVLAAMPFATGPSPLPWQSGETLLAPTTPQGRDVSVFSTAKPRARTHSAKIVPAQSVAQITIALPLAAGIDAIRIDGKPIGMAAFDANYYLVRFAAPPADGFALEVDADASAIDAVVADEVIGLPASANPLIEARGTLAVPIHTGDRSVTLRHVTF